MENITERFESVKQTGPGKWIARCPAHKDRTPSLSVRELDDGTILFHCFGGCEAIEVCNAIGIEFRELFPANEIRRNEHSERPRLSAADALAALDHEIQVVAIIGADFLSHRELDRATWSRLADAARRIGAARALCNPARAPR